MKKLLVDIGNTRIKWVLSDAIATLPQLKMQYAETIAALLTAWQNLAKPQAIAIANVTKTEQTEVLIKLVQGLWPDVPVTIAKTSDHAFGVQIAYAQAENLGVDRWLALIAIKHFHNLPAILVDCGTAMTIDVLAADGLHKGGLIVPGLKMMQQALLQGTHKLKTVDVNGQTTLGLSPSSCIKNGALFSLVSTVEKVFQQVADQDGLGYTLILTGGDGQLIYQYLTINALLDSTIVLQGLGLLIDD